MRNLFRFIFRHWHLTLAVILVGVIAINPNLVQTGIERILQALINTVVTLISAIGGAFLNAIGRNEVTLGNLFLLGITFYGIWLILRGIYKSIFGRSPQKK